MLLLHKCRDRQDGVVGSNSKRISFNCIHETTPYVRVLNRNNGKIYLDKRTSGLYICIWQICQIVNSWNYNSGSIMHNNSVNIFQDESEVFKALAHPVRLFVIHVIQKERLSVKELSERAGIDISTMSKHLDLLKRHKIITGEKEKNRVFYTLNIPCVLDFMTCARNVLKK